MEFNQTFYILIGQSLFFLVILALCLKLAVNKHRAHLKKIVEQINNSTVNQDEEGEKKQSSQQIRELLMKKIQQLQTKNVALEKIEVQHTNLKTKYESLRLSLLKGPGEAGGEEDGLSNGGGKEKETKKERFNRKTKCLNDATGSASKASRELKILNKKNSEQRSTIEVLRAQVKRYELVSDLSQVQNEKKDAALDSLKALEDALIESQSTSERLENNLETLRRELDKSKKEVDKLEKLRMKSESDDIHEKKNSDQKSYTLISKDSHEEDFDEEKDPFEIEAIQNYQNLKKEVQRLRSSTSDQRTMIFSLEGELIALRKELEIGGMSDEDQAEKEEQLSKLEKLLEETESCVDMLENEVTYLQDRIDTMATEPGSELEDEAEGDADPAQELELMRGELSTANEYLGVYEKIRTQLAAAIVAVSKAELNSRVQVIATHVLEALEDFGDQVYVKIAAKQGEIEVANSDKIASTLKAGLKGVLKLSAHSKATEYDQIENGQGLLIAHKRIGAYIKTGKKDKQGVEQLLAQLDYVLVAADSMIAAINKGRALQYQKVILQRVIDRVKRQLSTQGVQSNHKSAEVNRTINDFLTELHTSLHTMNLTENQSKFFDVMIDEVKERMDVLHETEVVVDAAFVEFIEKLDRGNK